LRRMTNIRRFTEFLTFGLSGKSIYRKLLSIMLGREKDCW